MFIAKNASEEIIGAFFHQQDPPLLQVPDNDPALLAFIDTPNNLASQAMRELNHVTGPSGTIIRCVAAGIAVPAAWKTYVQALRAIANGTDTTSTTLPTRPAYPAGT